jgi:nitrogen fixation protein NifU and related proteins
VATQESYSQQVLDHFARPRNLGRLPDASGTGTAGDLRDGPVQITIAVRLERGAAGEARVAASRFRAFGCSAAIAAASMATVLIEGRTATEAAALTPEAITAALGGLPEDRLYAPALAAEAAQRAIADCGLRIAD